ncbi:AsnC family transcriptional regulator [Mangrovibacter sp. MFB070]|uniref:Lrp/AsnC family transcriptional regulator n=1 Tax=Mangrovibacter sp. MFB070 TaxID=1224318 RepID=UPI0004D47391|nr:Lrp/AsnC family transcriptional regulator [Mangrovibacter sp. MFB070]KEA51036.1 AsnC family transcriptional regulator [Mangrovibacter sp. MFB070]
MENLSVSLHKKDIQLLMLLQQDARLTNQQLAEQCGMSATPCWRRIRQLEEAGVIAGYRAVLDRKKTGLGILAFVRVNIDSHSEQQAVSFEQAVCELPQVIACYAIGGGADFLLQVVARELDDYSDFAMKVIRRLPGIKAMETSFVLKEIKPLSGLPVGDGCRWP